MQLSILFENLKGEQNSFDIDSNGQTNLLDLPINGLTEIGVFPGVKEPSLSL